MNEEEIGKYVYEESIKINPNSVTEIALANLIAPADTLTIGSLKIDGIDCIRLRWWEKVLNLFKLIDVEPRFSVYITSDRGVLGEFFFFPRHLYYDNISELPYYAIQLFKPRIVVKNTSKRIIEAKIVIEGLLSSSITEDKNNRR